MMGVLGVGVWSAVSATTHWRHFDHGSDIGIRGVGRTMAEAFEQAAMALTAVICDPGSVSAEEVVEVDSDNPDPELLFVDWIDAVVYQVVTRQMLFSRFRVEMSGDHLHGWLYGEAIDIGRHQPAVEVKGATLTGLEVRRIEGGHWQAQCVVDV